MFCRCEAPVDSTVAETRVCKDCGKWIYKKYDDSAFKKLSEAGLSGVAVGESFKQALVKLLNKKELKCE